MTIPNRAIFSVDPGGETGLAWCIVDIKAPLAEMFKSAIMIGSTTVSGDEYHQIREIAQAWMGFYHFCVFEGQMPPDTVELVSEDFIERTDLRGKKHQSPIRILWGIEGYRMGRADEFKGRRKSKTKVHAPPIILQHPSLGSSVKGARLKEYGLWVVGKEHERSAFKHIVTRVKKIKSNL